MKSNLVRIDPLSQSEKKEDLENTELTVLDWKRSMVSIVALENSVTRNYVLMTEELTQQYGSKLFRNYGDHPTIQKFFDRVFADCHLEVRKCNEFLSSKISELLNELFDVMQSHDALGFPNNDQLIDKLFRIVSRNTELLLFVQANVQTINAVFDARLKEYDHATFKDFHNFVLDRKDECFQDILLHPALILTHFLCSKILSSIPGAPAHADLIQPTHENNTKKHKVKEIGNEQIIINAGTENDQLLPTRYMDIKNLLILQDDFFVKRHQLLLDKLRIPPEDYFNVRYFSVTSDKLLADQNLTVDQFFAKAKEYPTMIHHEHEEVKRKAAYNMLDLWMVLIHTFIYIINNYGFSMTAYLYAKSLKLDTSISGVIQGVTPAVAIFWGVCINFWTQSNNYYPPYITILVMLILANLLYYLAETYAETDSTKGVIILVAARVVMGIGGARLLTRKYIAINVQEWALTKYSALLTGMTAAGMCLGPGLSALVEYAEPVNIGDTKLAPHNMLSFLFIFIWGVVTVIFIFFFKGRDTSQIQSKNSKEPKILSQAEMALKIEQVDLQKNLNQIIEVSENPQLMQKIVILSQQELELVPQQSQKILWLHHPDSMTFYSLACFVCIKVG